MKNALKVLSLVLVMGFVVALLAGCGTQTAPAQVQGTTQAQASTQSAEKVKMRAVTYFTGEDPNAKAWKDVLKSYSDANPNVEISDEGVPSANDTIRTKIKTDFASGNEPDVSFFFTGSDTKPLVESGKLFAWDQEIAKDTTWSA